MLHQTNLSFCFCRGYAHRDAQEKLSLCSSHRCYGAVSSGTFPGHDSSLFLSISPRFSCGALLCLLLSPGIAHFLSPLFPKKVNWILWYHCTVWVLPCLVLSRTGGDTSHLCLIHSYGHRFDGHWLQALYKAVFVIGLPILCLYSSSHEMFREHTSA